MALTPTDYATTVTAACDELVQFAKARMRASVRVERLTGKKTTDPATAKVTQAMTVVYEGPAKLHDTGAGETSLPGSTSTTSTTAVHLPFDDAAAATLRRGDRITVLSSPDARYTGRVAWVNGPFMKDEATARRYPVTFDDAPAGW